MSSLPCARGGGIRATTSASMTVGSAKLSQPYKPQICSRFVTTLPSRDLQVNRATPPLAQGRLNATPPSFVTQGRLFYPSPRSTLLVRGSEHFIRPWRISSVVYNGFHRPVCRFHPALAGARLGAAWRGKAGYDSMFYPFEGHESLGICPM